MSREKIDFGIDLGTTNSAIAVMESGNVRIIKSDRRRNETLPSCVEFTRRQRIHVGDEALNGFEQELKRGNHGDSPNAYLEFKRTMGTDAKYFSSNMDQSFNSEELSAEVLKKLKSFVKEEEIQAAVITVPNQFRQNQIDATQRAAELSGFKYCELLQEPIAASMAFGVRSEKLQGYWIVFDFGGGTFDAALMKVDEGVMKVIDTDGDNHLGGKDLDNVIVEQILLPYLKEKYIIDNLFADDTGGSLLRGRLKTVAEEIKITLSSTDSADWFPDEPIDTDDMGEDIEPETKISLQTFEDVVFPIFQKAVDITKQLSARNNITNDDLSAVLLVGGPTLSQTLRRMLRDEFGDLVDTSFDPMTAVAYGAALFASTKNIPLELRQRDRSKVQLILKYRETTVELEESLGIKIDRTQTASEIPEILWVEISRTDGGWTSGKIKVENAEIIDFHLKSGKTNTFVIQITDEEGNSFPSQPTQFSIIQGLTVAAAILTRSMCVEYLELGSGEARLDGVNGLEKNTSLPAKGKSEFKTQKAIRPGNAKDILRIPLLEGEPGERAILNQSCAVVTCNGEDLSEFLPEGSKVKLTVEVDESRRITLIAYFPYIDETYTKKFGADRETEQTEIDADVLRQEIHKAQHTLNLLESQSTDLLDQELELLSQSLDAGGNDYDQKIKAFEELKKILKKIDILEQESEWPDAERRVNEGFERLNLTNEQYGDQKTTDIISQLESNAHTIMLEQDVKLANELIEQISALQFSLIRNETGLWIGYVKGFDDEFDSHEWSDPHAARKLIIEAKRVISTQPSREKLEAIVFGLFELLPDKDRPMVSDSDRELLVK